MGTGVVLTALDLGDATRLVRSGASSRGRRRDRIYQAVASLYRTQGHFLGERECAIMRDVLGWLAPHVETEIRVRTAEKVAADPRAPLSLVLFLIEDSLEVARPLIQRTRRLTQQALLDIASKTDIGRQILCAERPDLEEPVTDVLARKENEAVLLALSRNLRARIAPQAMARLVAKSRQFESLQQLLVRRPDLPHALAIKMYAWVPAPLRVHLQRQYGVPSDVPGKSFDEDKNAIPAMSSTEASRSNVRLIEKLALAGQLKPGFLVRVLHQGQVDLFELGFAKLLNIDHQEIRQVLYKGGVRTVALACRAVGIDRCVFPTVYHLSRQARRIPDSLTDAALRDADAVFSSCDKAKALAHLQVR